MSSGSDAGAGAFFGTFVAWLLIAVVGFGLWGCPKYNVYLQAKMGEGKLREAESSRQIATLEAKAKEESASLLAGAEVARAKGVARANQIIADSLKGNEVYLRYLWIQSLEDQKEKTVVYIPTEGNLPILEAHRLDHPAPAK